MNLLALTATFTGVQAPDQAVVAEALFGSDPSSARSILDRVSLGRLRIEGRVASGGELGAPPEDCADPFAWVARARANHVAAGGSTAGVTHIVAVVAPAAPCFFAGTARLPGSESVVLTAGRGRVYAHELIHNLGVGHASAYRCVGAAGLPVVVAEPTRCTTSEYGDPFSLMGSAEDMPPNVWHKRALGWARADEMPLAAGDTTIAIRPHNRDGAGPVALRFFLADGRLAFIDTWRSDGSVGVDAGSAVARGVVVRVVRSPFVAGGNTLLLDTRPTTPSFDDAPVLVGESVRLGEGGPAIEVLSSTDAATTVRVTGVGADITAPTPPLDLTAQPETGAGAVRLAWSAAIDDGDVAAYRVYRGGARIAETAGSEFTDAPPFDGAAITYAVAAVDRGGNEGSRAERLVITPDLVAPDAVGDLRAFDVGFGTVRLEWTLGPGSTRTRILRNGAPLTELRGTGGIFDRPDGGRFTYTLIAVDEAGNEGEPRSIDVQVAPSPPAGTFDPDVGPSIGVDPADTGPDPAAVEARATVTLRVVMPKRITRGVTTRITARVRARALVVRGRCRVDRFIGRRWMSIGAAPARAGVCRIPVRLGRIATERLRVRFIGGSGFANAISRPVPVRVVGRR